MLNNSNKFTESVGVRLTRKTESLQNDTQDGSEKETAQPKSLSATCDHRGSYVRGLWKGIKATDHGRM